MEEEKNELNDIILNKSGSNTGSKKLLLAIATFTLILIIVLVIMNSLKNDEVQKTPQAILPPEPTAPTEIINDPLFEPVEVIQEGNETTQGATDLNKVAQKIKNESMQNTPVVQNKVIEPLAIPTTKVAVEPSPVQKSAPAVVVAPTVAVVAQKVIVSKVAPKEKSLENIQKPQGTAIIKQAKAPLVKAEEPKKSVQEVAVPTPVKAAVVTDAKPATAVSVTYYIQVGSFTNEPNKALFDRLNASGMKYTTQKSASVTKILVGPFQGEKSVQDAMVSIRQNVEAKAFKIKG